MATTVLGISSSPRREGNSDLLLRSALEGAAEAGGQTEYLHLDDLAIAHCRACDACWKTGTCRWDDDDYPQLFRRLVQVDRLIFATPVHFMTVSSAAKVAIDRCQCLWARTYVLKQPVSPHPDADRRGMVIATGGSRNTRMFDCVRMTMQYFFDALQMKHVSSLFVNVVDDRGAVRNHPTALADAFRLGGLLVSEPHAPASPLEVKLYGTEKIPSSIRNQ